MVPVQGRWYQVLYYKGSTEIQLAGFYQVIPINQI